VRWLTSGGRRFTPRRSPFPEWATQGTGSLDHYAGEAGSGASSQADGQVEPLDQVN
jgi:hypothetical protein